MTDKYDPLTDESLFEDQDLWEEISSVIWQPKEVGDSLAGIVDGFAPFEEGDLDQEVFKWFIRGRGGTRYSMVGGSVFDTLMEKNNVRTGDMVSITWQGKKEISGGRSVNLFRVKRIPFEKLDEIAKSKGYKKVETSAPDDDIPF